MKTFFTTLLITLVALTSCTQDIDIDPRAEVKVVASCVLSNTDVQQLKLTYSKEIGGGRFFEEVEQGRESGSFTIAP